MSIMAQEELTRFELPITVLAHWTIKKNVFRSLTPATEQFFSPPSTTVHMTVHAQVCCVPITSKTSGRRLQHKERSNGSLRCLNVIHSSAELLSQRRLQPTRDQALSWESRLHQSSARAKLRRTWSTVAGSPSGAPCAADLRRSLGLVVITTPVRVPPRQRTGKVHGHGVAPSGRSGAQKKPVSRGARPW
jgi:hypothetical protein